jgi:hypothetical protein
MRVEPDAAGAGPAESFLFRGRGGEAGLRAVMGELQIQSRAFGAEERAPRGVTG